MFIANGVRGICLHFRNAKINVPLRSAAAGNTHPRCICDLYIYLIDLRLQTFGLQSQINGFSHGLKTVHRTVFLTAF